MLATGLMSMFVSTATMIIPLLAALSVTLDVYPMILMASAAMAELRVHVTSFYSPKRYRIWYRKNLNWRNGPCRCMAKLNCMGSYRRHRILITTTRIWFRRITISYKFKIIDK